MPQEQIPPGSITNVEISSTAAIQESKLLFDATSGHDHDTVGKQNLAVQISKRLLATQSSTPNLFVQIAASPGISFPQGNTPAILAQSINFSTTLPSTPNQRIDLIYLDSDGLLQIRQGTPSTTPVAPDHDGILPIAEIGPLANNTTAITTSLIRDVRSFISSHPVLKVQDHGTSDTYISTLNFAGALSTSTSSGISTISVTVPTQPDASTTVKGLTKLSVAPGSPTNPIAVGDNDPRLNPIPTAIQKNGSVIYTGNQDFGSNDIENAGTGTFSGGIVLEDGGTISSTDAGNISITPALNGKVKLGSTNTGLKLPNVAGDASFGELGDIWYDGVADALKVRIVAGPTVVPLTTPEPATITTLGEVRISTAPVSASIPIAVGDNDTRVPSQDENNALLGTNGTPNNSNRYVTNTDPRIPSTGEKQALVGTVGVGPSSGNLYVLADYANLPSTTQKAALAGTSGTPGGANPYVTTQDGRIPTTGEKQGLAGAGTASPSTLNKYVLEDFSRLPITGEKQALAGTTGVPSTSNRYVTQSDPLLPIAGQKQALAGSAGTPSSSNTYLTQNEPKLPTTAEKAALGGTSGVPSGSNQYVTASDLTYILRDGTRPFVNPISGIDPIISSHLSTKAYVDATAAAASNGAVGLPISTLSDLSAIPSGQRIDKQIILVEMGDNTGNGTMYYFDLESQGSGIPPNEGPGTWYQINSKTQVHNSLSGLQGGTSGQYFHLTSAQTTGLTAGAVTALHNHSHSALTNLAADDHTQYSLANGSRPFSAAVAGVTPSSAAHLTTKSYVDNLTQDASHLIKGITKLSVAPGSPTNPVAFGINDPAVFKSDGSNPATGEWDIDGNDIVNAAFISTEALNIFSSTEAGLNASLASIEASNSIGFILGSPPDTAEFRVVLGDDAGASLFNVLDSNSTSIFSIASDATILIDSDINISGHDIAGAAFISSESLNLFSSTEGGLSAQLASAESNDSISLILSSPPDTTSFRVVLGDDAGDSSFRVMDSTATATKLSVDSLGTTLINFSGGGTFQASGSLGQLTFLDEEGGFDHYLRAPGKTFVVHSDVPSAILTVNANSNVLVSLGDNDNSVSFKVENSDVINLLELPGDGNPRIRLGASGVFAVQDFSNNGVLTLAKDGDSGLYFTGLTSQFRIFNAALSPLFTVAHPGNVQITSDGAGSILAVGTLTGNPLIAAVHGTDEMFRCNDIGSFDTFGLTIYAGDDAGVKNIDLANNSGTPILSIVSSGSIDANGNKIVDLGTPTVASDAATKGYADGLIVDASTSVKGVTRLSVAPVSPTIPIAVGDNDPRLPDAGFVSSYLADSDAITTGFNVTGNLTPTTLKTFLIPANTLVIDKIFYVVRFYYTLTIGSGNDTRIEFDMSTSVTPGAALFAVQHNSDQVGYLEVSLSLSASNAFSAFACGESVPTASEGVTGATTLSFYDKGAGLAITPTVDNYIVFSSQNVIGSSTSNVIITGYTVEKKERQ